MFALAACSKLADRDGSRQMVAAFGVPSPLQGAVAGALAPVELAVGLLLLPAALAWYGGLAAFVLLGSFTAGMAVNLLRGRRPTCRCFGQIGAEPIGAASIVRNGVFGALALVVVLAGPQQPSFGLGVLGDSTASVIALVTGIVALAVSGVSIWLLLRMLEQQGRILLQIEALQAQLAGQAPLAGQAQLASTAARPTPDAAGTLPASAVGGSAAVPSSPAAVATAPMAPAAPPLPEPGLAVGTAAPSFSLPGIAGETQTLESLLVVDLPLLLVFADPQCGPCAELMPDVSAWQRSYADRFAPVVVSRGSVAENRAKADAQGLGTVLLQKDFEVGGAYGVAGTPSAVLVAVDGTIASSLRPGPDAIRQLVQQTFGAPAVSALVAVGSDSSDERRLEATNGQHEHVHADPHAGHDHGNGNGHGHAHAGHDHGVHSQMAPVAAIGQAAPEFRLPDLTGRLRSLDENRGQKSLVLFWHPDCGFCTQLLPELRAWEALRADSAPQLFVVSGGSAERNRTLGLQSTVVLDDTFSTATAFGSTGTPTAVLVDAQGNIASSVAVGGQAVMALAGPPR